MDLRKKLITGFGVVALSVLSLVGCDYIFMPHPTKNVHYVDFDGDGDCDLMVRAKSDDISGEAKLHFFENDGEGNLTLKRPSYSE